MSLAKATLRGVPVALRGEPPFRCHELRSLVGQDFTLPCEDPWLRKQGTRAHQYLDGAREAWHENPDWMDFLDLGSPIGDLKRAERDLYLHAWKDWLEAKTVLDVGCGIGRFTTAFLDRGATVIGVDGDLDSLRRCAWHAANRPGKLDLHWSSVHNLPDCQVDLVICAEVLCYVPKATEVLQAMADRLRPGGALLIAVEGRWGWACSEDAPAGALATALAGDGVIDVPGERWVRTYREEDLVSALEGAGLQVQQTHPMLYVLDGPLERTVPPSASLEELLTYEEACRAHPVWAPLARIQTAVATKPLAPTDL